VISSYEAKADTSSGTSGACTIGVCLYSATTAARGG
jgi:hypothetical protein